MAPLFGYLFKYAAISGLAPPLPALPERVVQEDAGRRRPLRGLLYSSQRTNIIGSKIVDGAKKEKENF